MRREISFACLIAPVHATCSARFVILINIQIIKLVVARHLSKIGTALEVITRRNEMERVWERGGPEMFWVGHYGVPLRRLGVGWRILLN